MAFSSFLRASIAGLLLVALPGCNIFKAEYKRLYVTPEKGEYTGLAGKTAVIIVHVRTDLLNEYTQAPLEITEFFRAQLVANVPSVRLVETREVLRWANVTDWSKLSDATIGKTFNVDRVIHIELVEYATKEPGPQGLVRARICSNVRVTETGPGDEGKVGWKKMSVGAVWPEQGAADMMSVNETDARKRALQLYGKVLATAFAEPGKSVSSAEKP